MELVTRIGGAEPPLAPTPIPLTALAAGARARLHCSELAKRDCDLLAALGLGCGSSFRICRAGDPWIVEVRSTRIGLADAVAGKLLVIPELAA